MKKFRILITIVTCVVMLGSVFVHGYVNTYDYKIGDIIGYSKYTDIRTFINGSEIQSYSINNYIFVAVEDLADYYFNVEWDETNNSLYLSRDMNYIESTVKFTSDPNTGKVNTSYLPILYTDIEVYFEGSFLRSFNLDGTIVIYADDLAAFTGADYTWDGSAKELILDATPYYIIAPAYQWLYSTGKTYVNEKVTEIKNSLMYKFSNKTENDDVTFNIVRHTGEYGGIYNITISGMSLSFSVSNDVEMSGKFWNDILDGANIKNGTRLETDTHERRIELYDVFRVYVNDTLVGGELEIRDGSDYIMFVFNLDTPYAIDEMDTIQLEIGYK